LLSGQVLAIISPVPNVINNSMKNTRSQRDADSKGHGYRFDALSETAPALKQAVGDSQTKTL
jgi:hypothetical protein